MSKEISRRKFIVGMTVGAMSAVGSGMLIGCAGQPENTSDIADTAADTDSADIMGKSEDEMRNADIKHIFQLGIVVPDCDEAVTNFCNLFAFDKGAVIPIDANSDLMKNTKYYGKDVEFTLKIALLNYRGMQFEFIEPTGGDENPYSEYLRKNGSGIHHINVLFSDFDESLAAIEDIGGKVMTEGNLMGGDYIYLDLLDQMGLTIETAKGLSEEYVQVILQS